MTSRAPETGAASNGDIQAVSRTAQILTLFGPETPEITVAEAAERLGLNRTTVHRYFNSLEAAGLLERTERNSVFTPGRLLLQLGAFAIGRRRVIQLATPYMRDLSRATGLTVVLSLWGPSGPVVSHVEDDESHGTIVTVRVGSQLPLDTAQALVFLAFLPDQLTADRLLGTLPVDQRMHVRERVARIREQGLCDPTVNPRGISVIAAPVFDKSAICATLAFVGTSHMLPVDAASREKALLREAADRVTAEMGGEARRSTTDDPREARHG
ncbi:IclR family transcriptional regulator [Actinophytocola gossypii]|uniref:IclR family transcriptional regulator n=1 Tax=Actinophytocola gossypii TaxID=2812003 RepID=A0ABT2J2H4_9PSEU|nr:IclR family transcriptional regulator [Actinophytocola gossypii]MCT2582062.1 IclR family transcriptional regulator [Actinophytocola gossypii]